MEKNEIIIPELNNETIESMIYIIRGQKVMLDFELAQIYGYETKRFVSTKDNHVTQLSHFWKHKKEKPTEIRSFEFRSVFLFIYSNVVRYGFTPW